MLKRTFNTEVHKQVLIIENRSISSIDPLFICAEIGVTCNYDMEITKKLIDVVARSGNVAGSYYWME